MSGTPEAAKDVTVRSAVTTDRSPLAERRRSTLRLEITREAVRLFTTKGVAATTAEEIAAAVGISVRTLWRHFPSKESCVLPLLSAGLDFTARCLRDWPAGQAVPDLLDVMLQGAGDLAEEWATVLNLVRLTRTEPGLRGVWLQAHDDAEVIFARGLAHRAGLSSTDLSITVQAAMLNSALRAAVEHYAFYSNDRQVSGDTMLDTLRVALLTAARGLQAEPPGTT
ncbi:MAG TPA: TetR/AcrR family transcriptional regulator [Rugosimonospora sp.]|nr:TetR/AcrR family transcriptional regulator [Rugosimonospora sp.]